MYIHFEKLDALTTSKATVYRYRRQLWSGWT